MFLHLLHSSYAPSFHQRRRRARVMEVTSECDSSFSPLHSSTLLISPLTPSASLGLLQLCSFIFFLLLILVSNTTGFYLTSPFPYTHFISSLSSSSTSVFTPASSSSQTLWKAVSDSIHYTYSQRADESVTNTQHRQGEEIKARRAGESETDEMKRLMTEPETSTFPPDIKTNLPNTTQRRLITSSEGGEQINKSQTDVLRTLFYSQCPRSILTLERIYWCPKGKFSAV